MTLLLAGDVQTDYRREDFMAHKIEFDDGFGEKEMGVTLPIAHPIS